MSPEPSLVHIGQLARELVGHASVATDDPLERASALIIAATVVIEQEVGRSIASAALMSLIAPTIADWQRPRGGEVKR